MEKLLYSLPLLLWACIPVHSSAVVGFNFVGWSNPTHSDLNDACCDPAAWICGTCDNYFIVCLDEIPGTDDITDCGIGSIQTATVFENKDEFYFPATIPNGISNPHQINVNRWQGRMRVKLQVWDQDNGGTDVKLEEASITVAQNAAASMSGAQWFEYTMGTKKTFTFQVTVFCNINYYGADCSEYCVPTDNQNGHYACDPTTGAKICHTGWGGENCDVDIDKCASGPCLNGATCVNEINGFSCICALGWEGRVCGNSSLPDDGSSTPGYTTSTHDGSATTDANAGDYFYCSDGRYIPKQWSCDRIIDCISGEDELRHCGLSGGAQRKRDSDPA